MASIHEIRSIRIKAENGDPVSQNQLGDLFHHGAAVQQDYAEALKWYTAAAFQGYPEAIFNTGMQYYEGMSVAKNLKKAEEWWIQGAEQGDPECQSSLAGLYFYDDDNGVGIMPDIGVQWYHKAIDQGYAPAMYNLALMYRNGIGVEHNILEAERLFFLASELGSRMSQQQLIELFYTPNDFEHDDSVRTTFIERIESNRYVAAQYDLGSRYYYGSGVEQNYKKAIEWWCRATVNGDPSAPFMLGMITYRGLFKPQSQEIARYWFQKSCDNGNPQGCCALEGIVANNRIPADIFAEHVVQDDFMCNGNKCPF